MGDHLRCATQCRIRPLVLLFRVCKPFHVKHCCCRLIFRGIRNQPRKVFFHIHCAYIRCWFNVSNQCDCLPVPHQLWKPLIFEFHACCILIKSFFSTLLNHQIIGLYLGKYVLPLFLLLCQCNKRKEFSPIHGAWNFFFSIICSCHYLTQSSLCKKICCHRSALF